MNPMALKDLEIAQILLQRPVTEICAVLTAETEESDRLRHNSPFAGALPPREVWEIKARLRHAAPAA